jgi:hypothetical protein
METSNNIQELGVWGKECTKIACNPWINPFHQRTNKLGIDKNATKWGF